MFCTLFFFHSSFLFMAPLGIYQSTVAGRSLPAPTMRTVVAGWESAKIQQSGLPMTVAQRVFRKSMLMERYSCVEWKQKKGERRRRRSAEYGVIIEDPPPPWQRSNRYPTSPSENSVRVSGQSDRLDMAFPPNRWFMLTLLSPGRAPACSGGLGFSLVVKPSTGIITLWTKWSVWSLDSWPSAHHGVVVSA